ncbi:guanylate-binding protein 4-like [Lingula anatina]|uniref:Guanylate-binding protein 4-like n=1 Tax=Lingula anatina TaxID=7574 RepID=A0A1S3J103_LINAN|nr:guanylate-binding protein 4-like [Lingula anatina]|eukprot:XP_013403936.1 guanylate-binding protein 4-like [Lingula anatina]
MGALRKMFPNFMWLLRDVHLQFKRPVTGDEMTPTDYVKEVVFRKASKEKKETDQEKIGRIILMAFEQVEAFALPSPGDEDVLADIAKKADNIKPKFNEKMDEFIEGILSVLECKRGMTEGSQITGDQLAAMLQHYVKAVNAPGTIPVIKSAWDASVELRRKNILEDMVKKYKNEMTEAINKACFKESEMFPLEERDDDPKKTSLMRIHDAVLKNVDDELKKQLESFGSDRQDSNDKLFFVLNEIIVQRQTNGDITGGELQNYLKENSERSRLYCEKVFKRLLDELRKRLDPMPAGYTEKNLKADVDKLEETYLQQAIGPMKLDVLREKLESSDMTGFFEMCKEMSRLKMEEVEAKRQRDILELKEKENQRKLQEAQEEHAREMKEQANAMEKVKERYQENIEKVQRSQEGDMSNFVKKMEDLKKAGQEEKLEMMQDFNRKLEEQREMSRREMEHQKEVWELKFQHQQELAAQAERQQKMRSRGVWARLWNTEPQ